MSNDNEELLIWRSALRRLVVPGHGERAGQRLEHSRDKRPPNGFECLIIAGNWSVAVRRHLPHRALFPRRASIRSAKEDECSAVPQLWRPFGRDAPVAGLIYAEFPVVGTVWVSLGDLEPLESK